MRRRPLIIGIAVAAVVLVIAIALVVWFLQPGPTISVQSGPLPDGSGAAVTVVGSHFPANQDIYVGLAAPGVPPTAGTSFVTAVTDRGGRFTVTFAYPSDPNWTQLPEVVVYAGTPQGDAVGTVRLSLSSIAWLLTPAAVKATLVPTVTVPAATVITVTVSSVTPGPVPTITLQLTSGIPGSTIIVTGRGWRANESLILSLLGFGAQIDATVNANAQGSFAATLVLPTDWGGPTATILARSSDGALQAAVNYRVLLPVPTYSLTVTSVGNGTITNIGTPAVINCRATCSASFNQGTKVTLKAAADTGYTFDGWSGVCSGKENCVVTMDGDKSVTATFKQKEFTLNTSVVDVRQGTIAKNPDQPTYTYGQVVTLIAKPEPGWSFDGWSGACLGKNISCQVKMDDNKSVQATFGINLTVTRPSGGTIKSTPGGINCGSICSANFDLDTLITLTAVPNTGYTFDHWSDVDVCPGTNPCIFNINGAQFITVTFARKSYTLTIATEGTGSGLVTPTVGTHPDLYGDVKLEATAYSNSTFSGWKGDAGCAARSVTMDANKTCTATFNIKTFTITATPVLSGTISIGTITPSGPQTVNYGASRTFTITANIGYEIKDVGVDGVSQGALENYNFDNVTANHTITATFKTNP